MDVEAAIERVLRLVKTLEVKESIESMLVANYAYLDNPQWRDADASADDQIGGCVEIAAAVDGELGKRMREGHEATGNRAELGVCRELIGLLRDREELDRILLPAGPKLSAAALHPWVWEPAARLWDAGHRREAIQAAATAVFDEWTPAKLGHGRDAKGGKDLMGKAFTTEDPKLGSPRLRLPGYDPGTPDWISAHEGAMHLGQGCAQYVRNLTTHSTEQPAPDQALEMLASLSLLARLIESAEVVSAS